MMFMNVNIYKDIITCSETSYDKVVKRILLMSIMDSKPYLYKCKLDKKQIHFKLL